MEADESYPIHVYSSPQTGYPNLRPFVLPYYMAAIRRSGGSGNQYGYRQQGTNSRELPAIEIMIVKKAHSFVHWQLVVGLTIISQRIMQCIHLLVR